MAAKIPDVVTIDFETKGIKRRPLYPPKPTSVSIQMPGERAPAFYCWGHPEGNNCDERKVRSILKDIARSKLPLLFHNAKFDYDVATTHLGVPEIDPLRIHDTLYLLFLENPHAFSLSLKPSSERLLGMKPDERDVVKDWILSHQQQVQETSGKHFTRGDWGDFIGEVPGDILGPYAKGDVIRTLKLFRKLYPQIHADGMGPAYDRERRLMPILLRNEREGIRIDIRQLELDVKSYTLSLARVDAWLRKTLKVKDLNVDSDHEVANALNDSGIVTRWATTPTGKRSVSKKNLTPDMFSNARVASALGYRNRLTTCLGTFMRPWLATALETNGIIHTNWNQVRNSDSGKGTRTGRLSSNPNFQNIPTDWYKKDDGYKHPKHLKIDELPMIRRYVLPDDKASLIGKRDYSQQELRIAAHFENGALRDAFLEDPNLDVHQFVTDEIYRVTGVEFQRKSVKVLNFGMLYGMGLGKLAIGINAPMDEARKLKAAHKKALPDIIDMDRGIKQAGRDGDPIRTWGGRLYYCEPPMIIDGRTMTWEYKLLNYLIQGSAADCTKEALIRYDSLRKDGRFMITVHDEIDISMPKGARKTELKRLQEAMEGIEFDVPMKSDGEYGPNWVELKAE
jgi:DNA polymerase-1